MTAVVAFGGFIAITANPHNESFPESLQEISVFVTALFNLAMTAFVSVLFFVLGHGVHVVILWVLSGFIKQMSFHPMKYNPFNKNDLWCESAALREKDNNAMANKIYRGFRLILLGVGSLVIIGCTKTDQSVSPESPELEKIAYPGAPIVSIQKTSVDLEYVPPPSYSDRIGQIKILYRLEVQEPPPYDIEVKLKVDGRSETVDGWTGIIDFFRRHTIKKDTLYSGKQMTFDYYNRLEPDPNGVQGKEPEKNWKTPRMQTVTVKIEPWDAIGDDAYNVGSPRSFTVKR